MKRLLVTGASGFLGWNVCHLAAGQLKPQPMGEITNAARQMILPMSH